MTKGNIDLRLSVLSAVKVSSSYSHPACDSWKQNDAGVLMNDDRTVTNDRAAVDVSLLILRVVVGVIFAAHGSQKMFGAFGGPGLSKIAEMMGPIGYPVAVGEFFGGLGLIVGFLCRFSAASLIVIMI